MKKPLSGRFVGLFTAVVTLAMATLIDASSSSQVEQLGLLAVPRTGHAATALADGRVLITGGRDSAGTIVATAEVFDPENQTSTAIGVLNTARINHTATLLANGRVLIAGGTGASGALTSAEIFDPANPGAGFRVLSARMGAARAGHTATRLHDGTVLIAGGDAAGTAEIFKPATESFSSTLLAMAAPRIGHTATLFSDDSVLLAGGSTDSMEYFSSLDQAFTLDPQKMTAARTGHEAIGLSDTRLLFFGGDTGHTIDEFNSSADTLTLKATMDGAPSSATLLANDKILVLRPDVAGIYAPDAADQATAFTLFDEASVPGSTALLRSGQTTTELSGDKKILVVGGQNAQHQPTLQIATFNPALIWTDKDDYLPDDPVFLFGSGWKASEDVYLYAVDSETEQWTYGSTAKANAQGSFAVEPYFIVEMRHLGTTFNVSAVGAQSNMQADVEFTDAGNITYSPATASLTITVGNSGFFSQNVTDPKNNDALTMSVLVNGTGGNPLPGAWVTTSPASLPFPGSSNDQTQSWTVTVAVPSNATPGTYTATIQADPTPNAQGGKVPNNNNKGTDLTVTVNPKPATSLAVGSATGTFGGTVSLSATLTSSGSGLNNKTINFTLNGLSVGSAVTNSSGLATLPNATLSGINFGTYPSGVGASFAGDSGFAAASGTGTLTVNKADQTISFDALANKTFGDADFMVSATASSGLPVSFSIASGPATISGNTVHITGAGSVTVHATQAGNSNYNAASAVDQSFTVGKADQTITFGPLANKTFGDSDFTVTATASSSLAVSFSIQSGPATISGNAVHLTGAGTVTVRATQAGNTNYNAATPVDQSFTVAKKTATITLGSLSQTYDGTAKHATATTSPAGLNVSFTYNGSSTAPTNAGSFVVVATIDDNNYQGSDTGTLVIEKANATITVTPYSATYTGSAHTATGTAKGVLNENLSGLDLSGTTHTNAGDYTTDPWTFTDTTGNYNNASGSVHDHVDKADATITVTPYSVTYTGTAHTATGTAKGVLNENLSGLDLSGTSHTNAGDYTTDPWTFTDATGNYNNASGSVHDHVDKADATITVTPYSVTYDAAAHTAIGTAKGVLNENLSGLDLSGTSHTNAGDYTTDPWTFTDATGNYNNASGSVHDHVDKADATITVTPYSVTYDAAAHTAIGTAKGVLNENLSGLDLSGTSHTNAGDYTTDPWTFTDATGNYNNASGSVHDHIDKANATVVVTAYNVTFDSSPHTATYTTTGVGSDTGAAGSSINVSATTHTNAGTYNGDAWTFTGGTNYNNQNGTVNDFIGKASATVVVTGYNVTFDSSPHTATYTITGVGSDTGAGGSSINVSAATHTNAGTYNGDAWTFTGGTNYDNQNGTVNDAIAKANATVVVTAYSFTYNGMPHTATYTVTGVGSDTGAAGSSINVSATTHTNAGTYNGDAWSFSGGTNYNDQSGSANDAIAKADATVMVTGYSVTYDGHSHTATYTITGVNSETGNTVGTVTLNTTHTNAGIYNTDSWSFTGGANYNDIGNTIITDTINKANATVVVTAYHVAYDNNPHTATITPITGVNGETGATVGTVDVSHTTHTLPGNYNTDYWFFTGAANYNDKPNTTITDTIGYGTCAGGGVILQPINADGTSVFPKSGRTVPVKFYVCDASGNHISDPNVVFAGTGGQLTMLSQVRSQLQTVDESGFNDVPDAAFRWAGDSWIWNMTTNNLQSGNKYTFHINLRNGTFIEFSIAIK